MVTYRHIYGPLPSRLSTGMTKRGTWKYWNPYLFLTQYMLHVSVWIKEYSGIFFVYRDPVVQKKDSPIRLSINKGQAIT
jgi:hypothetical protein